MSTPLPATPGGGTGRSEPDTPAGASSTPGDHWTWSRWHWAVLAAALVLRAGFALTLKGDQPFGGWDGLEFHAYAQNLLRFAGDDYPRFFNFIRAPFYSVFLMPFVALDSASIRHVQLFQCALGIWQVVLLGSIAARWGGRRAGNWALVIAAFHPFLIYYCGFVLTETLFITLVWAGMAALQRLVPAVEGAGKSAAPPDWWRWMSWAGVALAMGCLTRPGLQLFLPIAALWIGWLSWRESGIRTACLRMAGFTAVVSALLLPWQWGNLRVHGQFTLAPWHGQAVYYQTHAMEYVQTYRARTAAEYYQAFNRSCLDISVKDGLPREEWLPRARAFSREHPEVWWWLQWRKFVHFWTPWLNPVIFPKNQVLASALAETPLFLLAFAELWRRGRRRDPFLWLLYGMGVVGWLVGGLLFLTAVRYRIPFVDVAFLVLTAGWLGHLNVPRMSPVRPMEGKEAR